MGQDSVSMVHLSLAEVIAERIDLHDGDRVLGPACGTDQVARIAAQRYDMRIDIVGLDASQPWRQADWRALPFPDRSFDVVLRQDGLLDTPEPCAALRDIERVLVPGGRLAFTVWPEDLPRVTALADADAAAMSTAPDRRRDVDAIRKLLADAGFHDVEIQEITVMRRSPWSSAAIVDDLAEVDAEARQAMAQKMTACLDGEACVTPTNAYLAQAWTGGFWARFWQHTKTAWIKGYAFGPSPCCG